MCAGRQSGIDRKQIAEFKVVQQLSVAAVDGERSIAEVLRDGAVPPHGGAPGQALPSPPHPKSRPMYPTTSTAADAQVAPHPLITSDFTAHIANSDRIVEVSSTAAVQVVGEPSLLADVAAIDAAVATLMAAADAKEAAAAAAGAGTAPAVATGLAQFVTPGAAATVHLVLYDASRDQVIISADGGLLRGTGDGTAWEIVVAVAGPYDLDLQNADFFDPRAPVVETGSGFVVIVFLVRQLVTYERPIGDWSKLRRLARDSAARKGEGEGGEVELIKERLRWRGLPTRAAIVAAEGGGGAAAAGAPGGEQVLLGLCRIGLAALAPSLTYSVPLFMKRQCDRTLGLSL